jgi:hypothetical protein
MNAVLPQIETRRKAHIQEDSFYIAEHARGIFERTAMVEEL